MMKYYRTSSGYVATIGVVDGEEITEEEYEAATHEDEPDPVDPEPTMEERLAELEEQLAAAKIILGVE